jgi:hypothetical protein
MPRMIPYQELEKALRRWKVRQAGGTPEEAVVTEVTADAVVSSEVYAETSEETRAASGLMPVVQFDKD